MIATLTRTDAALIAASLTDPADVTVDYDVRRVTAADIVDGG